MNHWILLTLLILSPSAFATNPEVLECTVGFSIRPESNVKVNVTPGSIQSVRVIHSAKVPGNRWLHLIRFTGSSVSQFASKIKFESDETKSSRFDLIATSGRSFGQVQLFDLEFVSQEGGSEISHSAKAEMVSIPSPPELNSYASLSGNLGFQNSDVRDFEINCGTVGWNFGGL